MFKHLILFTVLVACTLGLVSVASALTVCHAVTPAYVNDNPKQFSVVTEKRDDGLLHFTITRQLSRPSYLVATTEVRDGDKVLFQSTASAFVHEDTATYYVTVAPERVADASFELFEGSFDESSGKPIAVIGGTIYQFQLGEFAKTASELKK